MAYQFVGLARAADADRVGAGGVGAHIGAALFLGHGHADGGAGLLRNRQVARVVLAGQDLRQPDLGEVRLQTQRRHTGIAHGHWAAGTGL